MDSFLSALSTSMFLTTMVHLFSCGAARDVLLPGTSLAVEDKSGVLHSPDGSFSCGFCNISSNAATFSIWFSNSSEKTIVWSANPLHPVYSWGSAVTLKVDGSMILTDYNGQLVWSNNASFSNVKHAELLDTGNLVVKDQGDKILWQSFHSPTDTLLPTQNITASLRLQSASRLLVPGRYSFHFDDESLLSLFDDEKDLSYIYWPNPHLNIWNKGRVFFNSTRVGVLDDLGHFHASDNVTFTAADWGPGVMRRLTLDYDGNLRLYSLDKSDGSWLVTWMAYPRLCFVRGLCGMNGICVYTPVPACACLPGYEVIDQTDRTKGCRPKFEITCHGMQKMKFVSLPQTEFLGGDLSTYQFISLEDCMNICLRDCNCKGFSYWQGSGKCYPKSILRGGVTDLALPGSIYLKLPEAIHVPNSSIPHSQPFGPKYGPDCSTMNRDFISEFLGMPKSNGSTSKYFYFYGFLSAIFLVEVILIAVGWCFVLRREARLLGVWPAEAGYEMITNHFRRYTYKELERATRNFKDELGKGSSGPVCKGVLTDERAIAVKKLADVNQGEEEFQHELSVIGRIYHMNLVRVWGFCSDGPHRILVFEYVENGSLARILFGSENLQILLDWKQRFKIAVGVAKGLAYLHHECVESVIHCDVKPENILLDRNLEPKITDFGLAKLLNRGGSNRNVSRVRGTRGYMAPEWVSSLPITAKVDVYSFGVVILELLKGVRVSEWATDVEGEVEIVLKRFVKLLAEKLERNEQSWITDYVDPRLCGQFNFLQARTMGKLAISCLEEERGRKPTMEHAVQVLLSVDEANSTI